MSNIKFSQLPNLGNLTAATIIPVVASGVNYTVTAANLQAYTNSTVGNVTAGYFLGNGSQLTGLPATYTNSNVTTLLAAFGSNTISTTGNVTSGYIFGNGSQLTGIPASYTNANVTTLLASFGSNTISTTGNVTSGNLTASGNVSGTYILGDGSLLSGLAGNYGNSNVTTLMAGFGSNTISTSGNITAGNVSTGGNVAGNYILGNGSLLTGLTGNYGNSNVITLMAAFGANTISSTGNITSGNLNTGGNVTGAYIKGNGGQLTGVVTSISAGTGISINQSTGAVTVTATNPNPYGNANVTTLMAGFGSNTISTTGNITSGYLFGNGSQLTGIAASYGNANVNTLLAAWGSNALSTTGNVTAGYVKGNGSSLTGTVTSIVAGSGISINQSTGAVTVTATGGGNSSVISSGFAFANVAATTASGGNIVWLYNGNVSASVNNWAGNSVIIQNYQGTKSATIFLASDGNINMSAATSQYTNLNGQTVIPAGSGFYVGFGTSTQTAIVGSGITTASLAVGSTGNLQIPATTKTGTSAGTAGQIAADTNYLYVCTATNVWKRVALTAF
jgi:hypothetical protein